MYLFLTFDLSFYFCRWNENQRVLEENAMQKAEIFRLKSKCKMYKKELKEQNEAMHNMTKELKELKKQMDRFVKKTKK